MQSDGRVVRPARVFQVVSPVMPVVLVMIVCMLSGLLTGSAHAEESGAGNEGIVIEADSTEYRIELEGTVVVAEGNALVTYKNFFASADYIRVQVGSGNLFARGNVVAHQETQSIK